MDLRSHSSRKRPGGGSLPMTSMIDVVFLLLIFFMVTSVMTPSESQLAAALQSERKGGRAADFQPQIISIEIFEGQPIFRIGERMLTTQDSLTSLLRGLPKESGVFVKVAGDVPVSAVAAAIQACKDAGFIKVSYVPVG